MEKFRHTPLTATTANLHVALRELLHAELHLQLDGGKEIPPLVADGIRRATEDLKGCEALLNIEQMKKRMKERGAQ